MLSRSRRCASPEDIHRHFDEIDSLEDASEQPDATAALGAMLAAVSKADGGAGSQGGTDSQGSAGSPRGADSKR